MAGTNIGHTTVGPRRVRMAGEMDEGSALKFQLSSGLMTNVVTPNLISPLHFKHATN